MGGRAARRHSSGKNRGGAPSRGSRRGAARARSQLEEKSSKKKRGPEAGPERNERTGRPGQQGRHERGGAPQPRGNERPGFGRRESPPEKSGYHSRLGSQRHFRPPTREAAPAAGKIPSVVEGRIEIHPDGFGFLIARDPSVPNIYVPEESLKYVMHRDELRVRVESVPHGGGKLRGVVLEIVRHQQRELLGVLRVFRGGALVVPTEARDRRHAFKVQNISDPRFHELKSGTPVLCKIVKYPEVSGGVVDIENVVEEPERASNDTLRIVLASGWPRDFSSAALKEAEERALAWRNEIQSRRIDIRHLKLVTIDGRDARDFDDAVYAEKLSGGDLRLVVAIADVSHFVVAGSVLDREAYDRATSVYFPDHVVPMLPEVLSNGVCSLNPFEERACLVCDMVIDTHGLIRGYKFFEGLMQSRRRMTYEQMQAYMDAEIWAQSELVELKDSLDPVMECYRRLRKAKERRGAIDLDLPEAQVLLNRDGTVRDIQSRARLEAHRLIEECMLAANECAARYLHEAASMGVYRVHEQPDEKKSFELIKFIEAAGLDWAARKRGDTQLTLEEPGDFAELLERLRQDFEPGDPTARAIQTLVLRSLKQARYTTDRLGHFALALKDYSHFTSPIRRYPDLLAHRLIKEALYRQTAPGMQDLEAQARHCSDQERLAMEMERKLVDMKKCRYMETRLGEEFEAFVTGVIEKGAFCQIEGHFVEGLVSSETLHSRARLRFDAEQMCYTGPNKVRVRLGSRLKVRLAAVDVEARTIDFDLLEILNS